MIKPNELRIGNLLAHMSGKIFEVIEIKEDGCITKPADGFETYIEPIIQSGDAIYELLPIRLNDSWISNAKGLYYGFKKFQDSYSVYCDEHCITSIKYVHELQNIIFILTGEELEIKTPIQ